MPSHISIYIRVWFCLTTGKKKKEMQAKLNRVYTKNKERKKKDMVNREREREMVPVVNDAKENNYHI